MTKEEFINREVYVWGEDYIFDLIDKGYNVIEVNGVFKWVAPVRANGTNAPNVSSVA